MAEKAGVSQATVSMILNRRSNVSFSAETVEKVECAARELGYELPHSKNKSNTRKEKLIEKPEGLLSQAWRSRLPRPAKQKPSLTFSSMRRET